MAKYVHTSVLDGGLDAIAGATKMLLLKTYLAADPYATVVANAVASQNMVAGDFSKSGADGAARVLTVAAKSGVPATANSGATPDLHIAFTNGVDTVLLVTDETTDQEIVSGNTVNFPELTYTSSQPAA